MRMSTRRTRFLAPLLAAAVVVAVAACGEDEGGGGQQQSGEFPRDETVFTSGNQWGPPSNWSPLSGSQATGVRGLIFETLFWFDPMNPDLGLQPYLAESGSWTSDNTFEVILREGIEWTDGTPMTAEDVVFTVELGQIESVPYSNLWTYLESVEAVDDRTARFTFTEARKGEFSLFLYSRQVLPRHLWEAHANDEVMSFANENPVGSGPYKYHSHNEQREVLERNDDWWGKEAFDIEMAPRYIIDVVNPSNEVALAMISTGQLDLSNNFLPGIDQLVGGNFNITTYYPEAPYMLPANTATLYPNHDRPPLDDPEFRRALAYSINTQAIVENVYRNIVQPANPTGLLSPLWDQFIDQAVVDEHGFSYDVEQARSILADAGYEDSNDDGFVEMPNGDEISLTMMVPAGWTDWMAAQDVIVAGFQEAGINVTGETPEAGAVDDARTTGDFDLLINNWHGVEAHPWNWWDAQFRLPVQENQFNANFERYENEEAWELVQQIGLLEVTDTAIQEPLSQLQEIYLTELPTIPMWYNGYWAQANNNVWSNWPAESGSNNYLPITWSGAFEKGAVFMFANIQPASEE
jgi:peptide/nickel transport system substrate-binding protein